MSFGPSREEQRHRAGRVGVGVLLIGLVVVSLVGQILVSLYVKGAFEPWSRVPTPTGSISYLYLGPQGQLLLEMADGRLLECEGPGLWVEVEAPADPPPVGFFQCAPGRSTFYAVRKPPQPVLQRVEVTCLGPESSMYHEYALLENGELWAWGHGFHSGATVILRCLACSGGWLGCLVLAAIVFAVLWFRASRPQVA